MSHQNDVVPPGAVPALPDADDAPTPSGGHDAAQPSRKLEIIAASVAVVVMTTFLVLVLQIDLRREADAGQMDARFWPTVLGGLGLTIALWRLIVALTQTPDERDDLERLQVGGVTRLLASLALVVGYMAIWELRTFVMFGYNFNLFVFITPLLLLGLLLIYGARSWKALVFFPLVSTAFIYLLFGMLLRIPL
ncbi:tripartite tricarboxylate transporter TctB family protein [Cryobacterium sp. PH29-G1]|uniref:tripartite tricarboxylate transporter TctB family protein n=1 Tax=Cryobacterium sp. PH29-G1 TaxID=3046211 RepID=UPI0024B9490F|nr:tripartite tricarboxylate transporter TctB family protein [Cryobacterium sp. PH29-G1]MDJ0350792.1 tripartite tricarboxylate transporter TctB family protein [Cryobacterium sp. PH29-G1]